MDRNQFDKSQYNQNGQFNQGQFNQNGSQQQYNGFYMYDSNNMVTGNARLYGILAYLGILFIVGLLASPEKDTAFVKNHVNNGIWLMIIGTASGAIVTAIGFIPFLGGILAGVTGPVVGLFTIVMAVLGIVNAANSRMFKLPVLGDILPTIIK